MGSLNKQMCIQHITHNWDNIDKMPPSWEYFAASDNKSLHLGDVACLTAAVCVMSHSESNTVTVAWEEVNAINMYTYLFFKTNESRIRDL